MAMNSVVQSWSTSQLVEYLAALAGQSDEVSAVRTAVERVLESVDAEIGIVFGPETTPVVVGLRGGDPRQSALIEAAGRRADAIDLPQLGTCRLATVSLGIGEDAMRLLVARAGTDEFRSDEMLLLRGMGWVLDLALRQLRVVSMLNERQRVLEHVSAVQRSIAARAPLPEVFDTVTESTLSLVGSELAVLQILDRDDFAVVSVSGRKHGQRPAPMLLRVGRRVAHEVRHHDRLVRIDDRGHMPCRQPECGDRCPVPEHLDSCARAVMGAPVRENGAVVGSLVVMSGPRGPAFAETQEQALLTFADQVSVALADAKTLAAAQHAVRDQVTGLPNRVLFLDRLEQALANASRVHVLFLDLDRFKLVNDTLGHAAGDDLLRQIGRRLRQCLRSADCLARFGGDEFAVLLENASDTAVVRCGERMLAAVQESYQVASEDVTVGGSIGVASGDDEAGPNEILRNADTAMYRAKNAGGGRIVHFEQGMHTALVQRRSIEGELRRAVNAEALTVVFQPIVGLGDRRLHAAEALVRWPHPMRGVVAPGDFIPLAEETGLIVPLGRQVLAAASAEAAAWPRIPGESTPPAVSVNVSTSQLLHPTFVADLRHILIDAGLEPRRLVLEITESTIVADLDGVLDAMRRIREIGVRLAIDDFGTGYSSLSYLRMFPVEILKIDRSFIESIVAPWQGTAFVRAIVRLTEALSMTSVAEGVETPEQVSALLEVGCDAGQGFLFAAPMSAAGFAAHVRGAGEVTDAGKRPDRLLTSRSG